MDQKDVELSGMPKPENKKFVSRRKFLKMAAPAVAGFALDRVVFKGFFSDLLWGFITNPQVRDKVMNKLQNLDEAVKEVKQQVEDRRTIREKVGLGEKMNVSEDWMRAFPRIEVYGLKDNEMLKNKTVFFADLPKIAVQVAPSEKKGGITRYSEPNEFLEESSVILPGLQVGSRTASNAHI